MPKYDIYKSKGIRIYPDNGIIECKKGTCNKCNKKTKVIETNTSYSLDLPTYDSSDSEYENDVHIYDNNNRYDDEGNIKKRKYSYYINDYLPTVEQILDDKDTDTNSISLCKNCINDLFEEVESSSSESE